MLSLRSFSPRSPYQFMHGSHFAFSKCSVVIPVITPVKTLKVKLGHLLPHIRTISFSGFNFHYRRPFAMPGNRSNKLVMNLFIIGISYVPATVLDVDG
ncbi:hypothetical protein HDU98_003115 [Podochytrium sp. JEL0797]|nr:hypothetical protein HDU98_003115 [Podochytrium sp. JEL0797]